MRYLIVVSSGDPETIWNAFHFATTCKTYNNEVTVFLMGQGVEAPSRGTEHYDIAAQMDLLRDKQGTIIGCDACCERRQDSMPNLMDELRCDAGTMQDLFVLTLESDKVVSF